MTRPLPTAPDVRTMRQSDLDAERRQIGLSKQALRRDGQLHRRADGDLPVYDKATIRRLAPLNRRLDEINVEDAARQQMPAREKW